MSLIVIKDKKLLDSFVGSQRMSQFLQSWEWGEFQRGAGRKIWRLGAVENNEMVSSVLAVKHTLPFGKNYLYCPRGPVIKTKNQRLNTKNVVGELLKKIIEIAKQKSSLFIRIEPPIEKSDLSILELLMASGYKLVATKFVQPKDTLILDLSKAEEELLSGMHHKTRYNILLEEKKGIKIRISDSQDFEKFWLLNTETAKRDGFKTHPKDYYKKMLESLPNDFLKLFIAEFQGKILVANLVLFFGDTVTYLHGASSDEYRNLMAPHLVQWRQIQEAKRLGFRYYDMWGMQPQKPQKITENTENTQKVTTEATEVAESTESHSWAGLTRFKKGFGGFEVNYAGTFDLILNKFWYKIYKTGRRLLRG